MFFTVCHPSEETLIHSLVKKFELNGMISKLKFKLFKDTVNLKLNETVRILTQQNVPSIRITIAI